MDLPVITNTQEITEVDLTESTYYLCEHPLEYTYSAAVILR